MKNQRGASLIELLVAGVVSTIVAGVILTTMYLSANQIDEGTKRFSMQKVYDVAAYQIGWTVREAATVLALGEVFSNRGGYLQKDAVNEFILYDRDGNMTGAFQINGDRLEQMNMATNSYEPFVVGGDTVIIANGSFFLLPGRFGIEMDFEMTKTGGNNTYTLASRQERFRCRNGDL